MSSLRKADGKASARTWCGLAVLALPTLLVSLDIFVMILALPHLGTDLRASSSQQLWIMDVYGFMVAGFMITMGTLGDRIGRRKLLMAGATVFGVASVLTAYSTSPEMLIASRALLGLAGASLTPSTLALITNMFQDAKQRASAVAVWAGCFGVGAIIGPMVGGFMLEHFWWGSVFLLGIPAMVLLVTVGRFLLPEYRNPVAGRLDPASVVMSLAAILPIVYGLKELARSGLQPIPLVAIAVGLAFGIGFVRRQSALPDPLLDLRLFSRRTFTTTLVAMTGFSMFSGGTMVFVAQYLQLVQGLSPFRTGLAMAPGMLAAIASFQIAPILARQIRPARLFASGLAVVIVGLLLLTQAGATGGLVVAIVGWMVTSAGSGPLVALGTNLVIGSAPPQNAGSAAGISSTGTEFGYALGIATLGSIGTLIYRTQFAHQLPTLSTDLAAVGGESLVGATRAAESLPESAASVLLTAARDAFTAGFHGVAIVAALALAGIAVLTLVNLRQLQPVRHDTAGQSDSDTASKASHVRQPIS